MIQKLIRTAALIGPLAFLVAIVVIGALTPNYDPMAQFISELGADGAPYAPVMNYLGILPFGVGMVLFGLGLIVGLHEGVVSRIGGSLTAIAGIGFTLAAINSCDAGCPFVDISLAAQIHNYAAFGAFLVLLPAVLLVAWAYYRHTRQLMVTFFQIAMLAALVMGLYGLFSLGPTHELTGAAQRLFIFGAIAWQATLAFRSIRASMKA